jgi:peptidyl-dipeptidase A
MIATIMAVIMTASGHPVEQFLDAFVPQVERKSKQATQAAWLLETTGSSDAADLKADLDFETRLLFNDQTTYEKLLEWDKDPSLNDPLLKRQLNVLIRAFKQNQIPKPLLEEIAQKEAFLSMSYANFRPEIEGRTLSENEILEIMKKERNPQKRQIAWEASKRIGDVLAPQILDLVRLRNQAARSLGYQDYFQMQLDLQEVDREWLLSLLEELAQRSDSSYSKTLDYIEAAQVQRFKVSRDELGPWAWDDPFCQKDPLDSEDLDSLVDTIDIVKTCTDFYSKMGFDVQPILRRSDMFERPGKNQHAFCIHIDRRGDVRTLNNVQPSMRWLETVLHELGHAVYELGFEENLPWLLREPPHMIPTEAMALMAGRQAHRYEALRQLVGDDESKKSLMLKADQGLQRHQLIFSRWVLVMTYFESELYRNPEQDLNRLWWQLVEKYQKIHPHKNREGSHDWAAKYHIGLAPVYYYSYLLGEMFASAIEEKLAEKTGSNILDSKEVGHFLGEKLFSPGNRMNWRDLAHYTTGNELGPDAWVRQFAK